MAKKIEITINGATYPCRQTMGAMLRFKRETGKEVTEIDGGFTDVCTYLWCCIASACAADGVKFDYTLMDFADSLTPEQVTGWAEAINEGSATDEGADAEKKKE